MFIIIMIVVLSLMCRPRYYDPWFGPRYNFFRPRHHRPMGPRPMGYGRRPMGGMHHGPGPMGGPHRH